MTDSLPSTKKKRAIVARGIMEKFSARTGLGCTKNEASTLVTRRYLWTDAFAVLNFFHSARYFPEDEEMHRRRAFHLIESVHNTLGKFRFEGTARSGEWLPGASEHKPTAGGLRIGKLLDERFQGEAYDSTTEWDKDGQYFHYLTKWMMALDMATRYTGETKYALWASELMIIAFERFVHKDYGRLQMHWKMSIDLTRPQMLSQGATDPINGYISACRLLSTCDKYNITFPDLPKLFEAKGTFFSMIHITPMDDPLDLGGMLMDIYLLEYYQETTAPDHHQKRLLLQLYGASVQGLQWITNSGQLQSAAQERIGFRELGLAIGLNAIERLVENGLAQKLKPFLAMTDDIISFWQNPVNQERASWVKNLDLSEVMLATSLDPDPWWW